MGLLTNGEVFIHGNFAKITRQKPKNWIDKEYKILTPYPFKWREKIGQVQCDCVEVIESYMPWYGFTFYHSEHCSLMKTVRRKPQLMNLWCYSHLPHLASSE